MQDSGWLPLLPDVFPACEETGLETDQHDSGDTFRCAGLSPSLLRPRCSAVNSQHILGIDNGGTVAKAALFSLDGRELGVASRRTEPLTPKPGWVEFDAERLWQATAAAVRQVLADTQIDPRSIAAVACTGHGNGLYLVDDRGLPVRNAIFSSDTRAQSYINQWMSDGIDRVVRPQTMQALWPGQPNALLAWLRDHEPESLQRTRWILMCKDYVRCRLTGQAFAELTDMSGTSLLDVGTERYDPHVLEAFGLGPLREKLPPLRRSAEICGEITPAAADATGLAAGTPVAGGMFDINACALSSALTEESILGMTLGTWGINQYVSRTPVVDGVFMTCRYCLPGYYLILEGSAASASNLEWFIPQVAAAELEAARLGGESVYARIDRVRAVRIAHAKRAAVRAFPVRVLCRSRCFGMPGGHACRARPP